MRAAGSARVSLGASEEKLELCFDRIGSRIEELETLHVLQSYILYLTLALSKFSNFFA